MCPIVHCDAIVSNSYTLIIFLPELELLYCLPISDRGGLGPGGALFFSPLKWARL